MSPDPRYMGHRLLWAFIVADAALWARVSAALDAALADPACDSYAPRCVFAGAAAAFDEFTAPSEALRYLAGEEIWAQSEARN